MWYTGISRPGVQFGMLPKIWLLLNIAHFVLASTVNEPLSSRLYERNEIYKRAYRLECQHLLLDGRSPSLSSFGTVQNLCVEYPTGLGANCYGHRMRFRTPRAHIYSINLVHGGHPPDLCRQFCRCVDVYPDRPMIQETAAVVDEGDCTGDARPHIRPTNPQGHPHQATATAVCPQRNNEGDLPYSEKYVCDRDFFGEPSSEDCAAVIQQLPDWGEERAFVREYYNMGETAPDNTGTEYVEAIINPPRRTATPYRGSIQSPLILTNGTCTIAVFSPDDRVLEDVVVFSQDLIETAENIRTQCVSGLGIGGKFDFFWNGWPRWIPNVFIFGPNSHIGELLNLKVACLREDEKLARCEDLTLWLKSLITDPEDMETDSDTLEAASGSASANDRQPACSGTCMDRNSCDINSDCLCATDKPFPLSSTWGQHACTYFAGAALALAQSTAVGPQSRCRGRCLSDDNNTLDASALANVTGDSIGFFNGTFANLTRSALNSPSTMVNTTFLPLNGSSVPISNIRHQASAMDLTCPCNCTYVSAACCLSRTVWEDPALQIKMDPLPANASICCDSSTGNWVPRSSLSECAKALPTHEHDSGTGFVDLGSVKTNASLTTGHIRKVIVDRIGGRA